MDRTYDLALSVLFLDKFGDARDEKLIQGLVLRLVAGQSPTGGWGYKCPPLSPDLSHELLLVLRKIAPGPSPIPLQGGPALTGYPAGTTGPNGQPVANPGLPLVAGPIGDGPGLAGTPTLNPSSPGDTTTKSPGEGVSPPGATLNLSSDAPSGDRSTLALEGREESLGSRRWAWCIKSEEEPPESAPIKAKPRESSYIVPRPVVVPAKLRRLTVLQDLSKIELADPKDKGDAVIYATTDNSNSQFAILALWIAQRHDVPMERTLRLIATRYQTSQNADGSWGYHYLLGGGDPEHAPMDCVGLLGLAVGHGLAQAGQGAANAVRDPQILNGFAALSRQVGVPAGRTHDLPLVNMYLLWSIERVAVLYNLPTIANKDWYRWGAEVLVANQSDQGDWPADGGYPGQTPMANNCLALLFLRRANLVADLTAALPFSADQLTKDIEDKVAPKEAKLANAPRSAVVGPTTAEPAAPPGLDGKPTQTPAPTIAPTPPAAARAPAPATTALAATADGGGRGWLGLVLVLVALLLLAAGGVLLFIHYRNRKENAKAAKTARAQKGRREAGGQTTDGRAGRQEIHWKNPSKCLTGRVRRRYKGIRGPGQRPATHSRPQTKEVSQSI